MEFGKIAVDQAQGCILAHTMRLAGRTLKKGTILEATHVALLKSAEITSIVAARPQAHDVGEDEAARRIADRVAGRHVRAAAAFTGRANLYAEKAGLFVAQRSRIAALNSVDEAITIATLAPLARVAVGQMVATVKIIPFLVPEQKLQQVEQVATDGTAPDLSVAAFQPLKVGLVLARLSGDSDKVVNKRRDAISERVARLGGSLATIRICEHSVGAVADQLQDLREQALDLVLVFGASAIVDRGDVVPAALEAAGGEIRHLGMPVDPGNLLLCGKLGERDMVGIPSCAASLKENGFDWVLERLFAGLALDRQAFVDMACGGLLTEIASRPQPRDRPQA